MSGRVAVAFRLPDNQIICQRRWTFSLGNAFKNVKMWECDIHHIASYIKACDYPEMIPVAPIQYGIIVVDYISQQLLSMQNYSVLNCLRPGHFMNIQRRYFDREEDWEAERSRVQRFLDERRLVINISRISKEQGEISQKNIPVTDTDLSKVIDLATKLWKHESGQCRVDFTIDTSPLSYFDYPLTLDGSNEFRNKLAEIGIPFTPRHRSHNGNCGKMVYCLFSKLLCAELCLYYY